MTVLLGDCRAILPTLEAGSVHCVVTSPPYFGLRDYGTASWEGGDPECDHLGPPRNQSDTSTLGIYADGTSRYKDGWKPELQTKQIAMGTPFKGTCGKCGAVRQDQQIGLEPTPEQYVAALVDVFREVRRVLRDDGTLWLNLGDSYAGGAGGRGDVGNLINGVQTRTTEVGAGRIARALSGLKPKDLVGIPWRVAFALQQPYHVGPIKRVEDRAWLAAMIDSDGGLGIRVQNSSAGANETFIPYIAISQTDTGALEHAAAITGLGSVRVKGEPGPHEDGRGIRSTRTYYTWRLDGQQASLVIRDIYPYLVIKRLQAQVVYAMNESLKWGRPSRSLPVPPAVMELRRHLYAAIKELNQRHPVTLPKMPEVEPADEPGWYLRSEIIWAKPNPMPESVTDRPTKSHEQIFLLSKRPTYWYDADAVREPYSPATESFNAMKAKFRPDITAATVVDRSKADPKNPDEGTVNRGNGGLYLNGGAAMNPAGRNLRSVWTIATQPYPGAHFATFPPKLVEPCILAGCPDRTCSECGAPWERVVERATEPQRFGTWKASGETHRNDLERKGGFYPVATSSGFRPTCTHGSGLGLAGETVPGTVLDPFAGSGTVGMVAEKLSRKWLLIELNPAYIDQADLRTAQSGLGLTG